MLRDERTVAFVKKDVDNFLKCFPLWWDNLGRIPKPEDVNEDVAYAWDTKKEIAKKLVEIANIRYERN